MGSVMTVWTIRMAVLLLFAVLIGKVVAIGSGAKSKQQPDSFKMTPLINCLSWVWFVGAIFALIHMILAFQFYHHWSHTAAVVETATQTEELIGWAFGGGIYFNYLFVMLWLIDGIWWLVNPATYLRRPRYWSFVVDGFLLFIAVNGTIIFESGFSRWLGVTLLATLLFCIMYKSYSGKESKH